MKTKLRVQIVPLPTPSAAAELDAALDLLADAIAERCIVRARAEVAAELGVPVESLGRERFTLTDEDRYGSVGRESQP